MNRLRSETKHALPRPPPSFVIILNVILISLIVLIILCSNLSLRSTIPASFFPALFQRWKRRRLLCQKPKATWCLPGSFLPPGYSSSPKAISYSLQNLSPKHNKRRGRGGGRSHTFLSQVKSSPCFSTLFGEKLSVPNTSHKSFAEWNEKSEKAQRKKPNPNHLHSSMPQQFHGTAPKTSH